MAAIRNFEAAHDFDLAVSMGLISGVGNFAKFGYREGVPDTVGYYPIWSLNGTYTFPNDAGESMVIVSDNAADNQFVRIFSLDENWIEREIDIQLNGLTPVPIPGLISRINRTLNIDSSRTLGNVRIKDAATQTKTYAGFLVEDQITMQMIYSVPANKKAFIRYGVATMNETTNSNAVAVIRVRTRVFGGVFTVGARLGLNKEGSSTRDLLTPDYPELEPKEDLMVDVKADDLDCNMSSRISFRTVVI